MNVLHFVGVGCLALSAAAAGDGLVDDQFVPDLPSIAQKVWTVQPAGEFVYVATDAVYRLTSAGARDQSFVSEIPALAYSTIVVTREGKLVVATRGGVEKISATGKRDPDFHAYQFGPVVSPGETVGPLVYAGAVDGKGRILVRGTFALVGSSQCLARLLPDGGIDDSFRPAGNIGAGFAELLPDGSIIADDGAGRAVRLHADGSRDTRFPSIAADRAFVLSDGTLAVALGGTILLYNQDGMPRSEFAMSKRFDFGVDDVVLADGKLLVSGAATDPESSVVTAQIVRLNCDGSVDPTWTSPDLTYVDRGLPTFDRAEHLAVDSAGRVYAVLRRPLADGKPGLLRLIVQRGSTTVRNVSARGKVSPGAPLIAGFVVNGRDHRVFARGVGPGLAAFGIADPVAQPQIDIYRGKNLVLQAAAHAKTEQESAAERATGAFPGTAGDASGVISLPAGEYTLVVSTADGGGGTALAEVYSMEED